MKFKDFILENEKIKKGLFHKWAIEKGFIKSMSDKITDKAIEAGLKDKDEHVRRMAQFAKNVKK